LVFFLLLEGCLKYLGLRNAVGIKLVLDDLFLQDLVAELKLVYAIHEVLLANILTAADTTCANNCCPPAL
jgi:hypothetical protein